MATAAPEVPLLARDLAFEKLYRRYVKDVYHYALAMLRNPADAEDVTQTTFLNAYRAFKRGEEPEKPQNWLIKIAHNAARTRYARSMRRVKEVPLEDHLDSLPVAEDEKPDVAAVLAALGELPLNQRAALVMRELEGRSYAEIADTLGVSVAAVETLIFRARRSLKVKASAVRVLSVVPLPPSLAHLFGGGTVVAGGGAAIGSSLLFKAAVAVVAGAVATGVTGGERGLKAQAAAQPAAAAAPPWKSVGAFSRTFFAPTNKTVVATSERRRSKARSVHARMPRIAADKGKDASAPAQAPRQGVDPAAAAPAAPAKATTIPSTQSNPVESVTQVVSSVPVPAPKLPPAPQLPPAPAVPPVPAVPPLPPTPSVPLPSTPSVPLPSTPSVPTLP